MHSFCLFNASLFSLPYIHFVSLIHSFSLFLSLQALIDQINAEEQIAKDKLEEAERLLKEAQENVKDARKAYKVLTDVEDGDAAAAEMVAAAAPPSARLRRSARSRRTSPAACGLGRRPRIPHRRCPDTDAAAAAAYAAAAAAAGGRRDEARDRRRSSTFPMIGRRLRPARGSRNSRVDPAKDRDTDALRPDDGAAGFRFHRARYFLHRHHHHRRRETKAWTKAEDCAGRMDR